MVVRESLRSWHSDTVQFSVCISNGMVYEAISPRLTVRLLLWHLRISLVRACYFADIQLSTSTYHQTQHPLIISTLVSHQAKISRNAS